MKKRILTVLVSALLLSFALPGLAFAEEIPLRQTFEEKGYLVDWQPTTPDMAYVTIDDYQIVFHSQSNIIAVDEGEFLLTGTTYQENGITYMSDDAAALCENLYLYHSAVLDAMVAEKEELLPLKAIDANQEKVLVCTWNRSPDVYVTGTEVTLSDGEVWVFTAEEIMEWGAENGMAEDMVLRMEQLIGLPPQKGYTHFSLLWADPDDLFRPAKDNEIDDTTAQLEFPESATPEYIQWFKDNAAYSYSPHRYPWTGLGYTYDWSPNSGEYGLSEFILRDGARVTVEQTYSNHEFFTYITNQ